MKDRRISKILKSIGFEKEEGKERERWEKKELSELGVGQLLLVKHALQCFFVKEAIDKFADI